MKNFTSLLPPGLILAWCVIAAPSVRAQKVGVEGGNVVFTDSSGHAVRLTDTGRDSAPDLSPDGERVVFVRATPGQMVQTATGEEEATELWVINADGTHPGRLARGVGAKKPQDGLACLETPQFSPDGARVFFLSLAWVTSGAVHVVDLGTRRVRFVCAGNELQVVQTGEYRGHLLVQQHRYFLGGGSFDWFWLFSPDGKKEIGPVGEDTANFLETFGK